MTRAADKMDLGVFVLQDHAGARDGTPQALRQSIAGLRISDFPDPSQSGGPIRYGRDRQLGTIGDVHPWLFWQTRDRPTRGTGSWAQSFASMVTSSDSNYGTAGVSPFRKNWVTDGRYYSKPIAPAAGMPWFPLGSMVMLTPGTDEDDQFEHAMWADPRLIAPNVEGPGECGTLVCDLQGAGKICMDGSAEPGNGGRHARLQSLVRVIATGEDQGLARLGSPGNILALNHTLSGADGLPGYGAVFGAVDGRSSGPITGGGSNGGGGGPITGQGGLNQFAGPEIGPGDLGAGSDPFGGPLIGNAADAGAQPNQSGRLRKNPKAGHGIGMMAAVGAMGPIHCGNRQDKHQFGEDFDGHPINAAHISTSANYYYDQRFDAPMLFEPLFYPQPAGFPATSRVHLCYDEKASHAFVDGYREGYWRWFAEVPDMAPKDPGGGGGGGGGGPGTPGGGRPGGPNTPGGGRGRGPVTGGGGRGPVTGGGGGGPNTGGGRGGDGRPDGGGRPSTGGYWPGPPPPPGPYRTPPFVGPDGRLTDDPSKRGPTTPGSKGGPPPFPGGYRTPPFVGPDGRLSDKKYPGTGGGQGGGDGSDPDEPGDGPGNGGPITGGTGMCNESDVAGRLSQGPNDPENSEAFERSSPAMRRLMRESDARAHMAGIGYNRRSIGTDDNDPRESMGRWSGRDPHTRFVEHVPGVREFIGQTSDGDRGSYTLQRSMMSGFAAITFRPQLWVERYPNFEHNPQLPQRMMERDERTRPQTVVMRAWGKQLTGSGDWDYNQRPMDSRARGGTVDGGVMFSIPRHEGEDLFQIGSWHDVEDLTDAATTEAHVLLTPGVNLSFGTPQVTGTSPVDANAVRMYRDTAANNYAWKLEVAGVDALRAYKSAGNPVVEVYNGTSWTALPGGGGGGGISDGDKGDITVSSSGTVWTIDADTVTYDKMQDTSGTDVLLGRSSAGGGTIEEIDCTAAGRALLDDASASAQRTTLGLGSAAVEDTSAFAAASHNHVLADITDAGTAAALNTGDVLQVANNLSDIDNASFARVNLGLGTAAVSDSTAFASSTDVAAAWRIAWKEHWDFLDGSRWNAVTTGSGAAYIQDASALSALNSIPGFGWARVHCGSTTATGNYGAFVMDQVGTFGRWLSSTGEWRIRFRLLTLNAGNLKASFGLTDVSPTTLRPVNSVMFEADNNTSTNIRAITYNGTTTNNTDTGVAISTIDTNAGGTARWFEIRTKSGQVTFYIGGTLVATITTNLPAAGDSHFSPFLYVEEDGSTFRSLLCDYIDIAMPSEWMDADGY